jgi:hypothetical protein
MDIDIPTDPPKQARFVMTHADALGAATAPAYSPHSDRVPATSGTPRPWTLAQRLGFRFALVYVLLYTFPSPLDVIPWVENIGTPYEALWRRVVPWVGAHVLRLPQPISLTPSGSGDKLFDWVLVLTLLVIAASVAIVWTIVDRQPRSHQRLLAAFRLFLRFKLAATMLSYGFDKVIPNQFEPMNPFRLTQYIGEAAPGGFAWSFLGFSLTYEVFAGVGESLAGLLLLFRRTSTLGAAIGAAVLTNVFMLNMSYDIPVKQYSGHLLLMCLALVAFDANRLLDLFIRQRPAAGPRFVELFTSRRAIWASRIVGTVLAGFIIGVQFWNEYQFYYEGGRGAPRGPLYGIFEVENVVKNGVVQPALLTDATRWRRLSVSNRRSSVRFATDSLALVRVVADSTTHSVTFTSAPDTLRKLVAAYAFPDSMHLVMRGRAGADSIEMTFRRRREDSFRLVGRGFHWVNEVPYFR